MYAANQHKATLNLQFAKGSDREIFGNVTFPPVNRRQRDAVYAVDIILVILERLAMEDLNKFRYVASLRSTYVFEVTHSVAPFTHGAPPSD